MDGHFEDDRLRLIFTCCHPSLATDTQVALALRMLCGLSTTEVAKAFLVKESAMAARLTRAKKKIALARIPYRVPEPSELRDRIDAVLLVIHLLFTTGHTSPTGENLSQLELVERALDLARMLHGLLPDDAEVSSLLALILLTDSRRAARVGPDGEFLALADQDRSRWHRDSIDEGLALVGRSIRQGRPGRFTLMAAIAAVHSSASHWDETDWTEIVGLYDLLLDAWPSPVVALNRAVAVSFAFGPEVGLEALDRLEYRSPTQHVPVPGGGPRRLLGAARPFRRRARRLRRGRDADREPSRARISAIADRPAQLIGASVGGVGVSVGDSVGSASSRTEWFLWQLSQVARNVSGSGMSGMKKKVNVRLMPTTVWT